MNRRIKRLIFHLVLVFGATVRVTFSQDIEHILQQPGDAVVMLQTYDREGEPLAMGSASVVRSDGVLLTNAHVIEKAFTINVKFQSSKVFTVTNVGYVDTRRDIAVLKIDTTNLHELPLGNSDSVRVGERVLAIGNPHGLEHTVSEGIISAVRPTQFEPGVVLQTTAAISPGSSGGALINMKGELVGVITFLITGQNLNFAISINDVKPFLADTAWKEFRSYAEEQFIHSADYLLLGAHCVKGAVGAKESLPLFKKILEVDPENTDAHLELASVYEALHDTTKSIAEYIEVIRVEPENAQAHFGLGKHLALKGRKADALEEYRILRKLDSARAQELFSFIYSGKEKK